MGPAHMSSQELVEYARVNGVEDRSAVCLPVCLLCLSMSLWFCVLVYICTKPVGQSLCVRVFLSVRPSAYVRVTDC